MAMEKPERILITFPRPLGQWVRKQAYDRGVSIADVVRAAVELAKSEQEAADVLE